MFEQPTPTKVHGRVIAVDMGRGITFEFRATEMTERHALTLAELTFNGTLQAIRFGPPLTFEQARPLFEILSELLPGVEVTHHG